jgi:hypothetical protein
MSGALAVMLGAFIGACAYLIVCSPESRRRVADAAVIAAATLGFTFAFVISTVVHIPSIFDPIAQRIDDAFQPVEIGTAVSIDRTACSEIEGTP